MNLDALGDVLLALLLSFLLASILALSTCSAYGALSRKQALADEEMRLSAEADLLLRQAADGIKFAKNIKTALDDQPPDGMDVRTLTAAELQWLDRVGLLPWAGRELERRTTEARKLVEQNLKYMNGVNDEMLEHARRKGVEVDVPPSLLDPAGRDDEAEWVTLENGVTVKFEKSRFLGGNRLEFDPPLNPNKLARESDERIKREFRRAWNGNDHKTAVALRDEAVRRGGGVDWHGDMFIPEKPAEEK